MDYVVGSVAALISGNVTPNRPKITRRALTPTKHQASPNVTPKSEFVEDRSIFLSPTQQKKKAIVKKSPKRIFQNPDLDVTEDCEGNSSISSPKAEKVKKHLKEDLDADDMGKKKSVTKSPSNEIDKSTGEISPKKKSKIVDNSQVGTPKKKKSSNFESNVTGNASVGVNIVNTKPELVEIPTITESNIKTPKKKKRKLADEIQTADTEAALTYSPNKRENSISCKINSSEGTTLPNNQENKKSKKRKKNNKKPQNIDTNTPLDNKENTQNATELQKQNKKKKNHKNKAQQKSIIEDIPSQETDEMNVDDVESESEFDEAKSKNIPNPNAITEKDSDSEHDSDDEIESENEQENEKILTNENQPEESSDEEEQEPSSKKKESNNQQKEKEVVMTEAEIKRTLFVGNVPFSSKCKKEVKKIFSKYGQIDTIRIRTIPVKDARVTPKLAIIKNELHPERTTVNVYVKFADPASVNKALTENNTVVNGNHLRVSRSDSTGAEHDPHCAVFVGNLPFAVEDDTLRSKFENCGEITSVRIIRDKKTNAGKGFGYVNFASKDGVELALALSEEDLTIKNRIIRVKRCTQQRPGGGKPSGGKWANQGQGGGNRGNQGQAGKWNSRGQTERWGNQGQGGGKWGGQGQDRGNRGNQGQTGKWGNQGQGGGKWGGQGQDRGNRGYQGQAGKWGNQGQGGGKWGGQGQDGGKWGNQGQGKEEGAARRLMNKRKQDGASEGPPNKMQKNVNQPIKEKKPRKEFVGMTAEKKKKHKPNKGLKQKKALSEILTKKS